MITLARYSWLMNTQKTAFFGVILGICVQRDCEAGLSEKQLSVSIESHNKACLCSSSVLKKKQYNWDISNDIRAKSQSQKLPTLAHWPPGRPHSKCGVHVLHKAGFSNTEFMISMIIQPRYKWGMTISLGFQRCGTV